MANPTFDGAALTTDAPAERIGSPLIRIYPQALPGVRGEFIQADPPAGRDIVVTGLYRGTPAATTLAAQAALKEALRSLQAKAGSGPAAYRGIDLHTYSTCVLKSFDPAGDVQYVRAGGNCEALVRIRAVVRDLSP